MNRRPFICHGHEKVNNSPAVTVFISNCSGVLLNSVGTYQRLHLSKRINKILGIDGDYRLKLCRRDANAEFKCPSNNQETRYNASLATFH